MGELTPDGNHQDDVHAREEGTVMRRRQLWGGVLLVVGILLLLGNLGYISFDFGVVIRLWPLILIYMGLVRILEYLNA